MLFNIPLYAYLHFVYSSTNGHLDFFDLFSIVNSAAVNIHIQVFVWILFSVLEGIHLGAELQGYMSFTI